MVQKDAGTKISIGKAILHREFSPLRHKWVLTSISFLLVTIGAQVAVALATAEVDKITNIQALYSLVLEQLSVWLALSAAIIIVGLLLVDTLVSLRRLAENNAQRMRNRISELEKEVDAKDLVITNQTERYRVDHITQIPNEIALHHEKSGKISAGKVLIMLDIVDFGSINNKLGRQQANEFLKALGQYLFLGARRLENVYRLNKSKMELKIPTNGGAYRLHQAGDEFVVILQGNEADALGFLTRVRRFCQKYSATNLPSLPNELLFYAGVTAVVDTGNVDEQFVYLDNCLQEAKLGSDVCRVRWHSGLSSAELQRLDDEPEDVFARRRNTYAAFEVDSYWRGKAIAKPIEVRNDE